MLTNKKLGLVLGAALLATTPFAASAQEAPKGFNQCKACHLIGKNGVGPNLVGVFGRKAGTAEGFKFSEPHIKSGLTWDEATLTKYLADPKGTVPGNKMVFAGIKNPEDLAAVVAYLKTLK